MAEPPNNKWGKYFSGELLKKWPKSADGAPVRPTFLKHCSSVSMDDELTVGLLEHYGIPCVKDYPNNGDFGRVILGIAGCGMDIYVPETLLEDALALLEGEPYEGE